MDKTEMLLPQTLRAVLEFDDWMTRRPSVGRCQSIEDLGFGQLNDLLLVMLFPEMAQEFLDSPCQDERGLGQLMELSRVQPFRDFGVELFILQVERHLTKLSLAGAFSDFEETSEALLANLCWVAYSIERWGQAVLRRRPGHIVNSVRLGNSSETLHNFLTKRLEHYNTLERFALRSIGSVNGIRRFRYRDGALIDDGVHEIESAYNVLRSYADPAVSRFPSTLDMAPFLEVIKKGELAAHVYNDLALELIAAIRGYGLDSDKALDIARSFCLGLRIARQAIVDFLRNDRFTTQKFIYVLRQYTIELDESPASFVLRYVNLDAYERIIATGFLNHYLQVAPNEDRSRGLMAWEWLRNEGVALPKIGSWLSEFESASPAERLKCCRSKLPHPSNSGASVALDAVVELVADSQKRCGQIRYALTLFKKLIPRVADAISQLLTDECFVRDLESKLISSNYALAPSGANSLAFFGGDILLGVVDELPNYRTHLLNRLSIMVPSDRLRYWEFVRSDFPGLPLLIKEAVSENVPRRESADTSSMAFISEICAKEPQRLTKYRPYFEIFNAFADLSKGHNASVEKFLRRVAQQMPRRTKERLLSSPDHGTTFMQPLGISRQEDHRLTLPSLDKLNAVRTVNQRFTLECVEEVTDHSSSGCSNFYRSFFS